VVRWRIIDLCQWLWDEFQISVSKQTVGRELRRMRFRKLSARPRHHAQAAGVIEAFKKSPALLASVAHQQGINVVNIEVVQRLLPEQLGLSPLPSIPPVNLTLQR
jgi:hypothetical protein